MAHFALVKDGIVSNVIVVNNDAIGGGVFPESEPIGQAFITSPHPEGLALEGDWKQTSYSGSFRGCFAGLGFSYDPAADVFIPPVSLEPEPESLIAP